MQAVSDGVTGQILKHGAGYVAWKIAPDSLVSDANRRRIIEEFLRNVPILIVPNAFKGNLTARNAAQSIERGIRYVLPDAPINIVPTADGGDGTRETLVDATKGESHWACVKGPLREVIHAPFGILGDGKTAVIEMAETSGLRHVEASNCAKDPMTATTYGVGQAILAALKQGKEIENVIICLGGSASTDGGVGALAALGYRFFDAAGNAVDASQGGSILSSIHSIDCSGVPDEVKALKLKVACDVENPPYGQKGAAYTFGPQKGANEEQKKQLDAGVKNLCEVIAKPISSGGLGIDLSRLAGGGAAGALGMGLAAIGGELTPGFKLVAEATNLNEHIKKAAIVITAEGMFDETSLNGKAPIGVAEIVHSSGSPKHLVGLGGNLKDDHAFYQAGFDYVSSTITEAIPWQVAKANSSQDLERAAARWARSFVNFLYSSQGLKAPGLARHGERATLRAM
jgi:glycerate kinase